MSEALLVGSAVAVGAPAVWLWQHRRRRRQVCRDLLTRSTGMQPVEAPMLQFPDWLKSLNTEFCLTSFLRTEHVLGENSLERLRAEAESVLPQVERSYIPRHKKGGTVSYEALCRHAPLAVAIYHSERLRQFLSGIVGEEVHPTPVSDQSSCSLLCYTQAGDHIGWHFDHNFYRGRHFTVLITLIHRGRDGGLAASRLMRVTPSGAVEVDASENTLVAFEGSRVRHCATPSAEGDLRVVLSMTFSTDPRTGWIRETARRVKDTAFYGVRALWD